MEPLDLLYRKYTSYDILMEEFRHPVTEKFYHPTFPALTKVFKDGKRVIEYYTLPGEQHSTIGPAVIQYDADGLVERFEYRLHNTKYGYDEWKKIVGDSEIFNIENGYPCQDGAIWYPDVWE